MTRSTTKILPADAAAIAAAGALIRAGKLAAFPTETVYGLGADATDGLAVAAVYEAKGRPTFNPLIAHVGDLAAARAQGEFNSDALALAHAFWPGPLTLVVPARPDCAVCDLARAGLASVALRVPAHDVAQALIRAAGRPLAAPSANRSGRISATTAAHVFTGLEGRIDIILDGGAAAVGVESTIVACLDGTPRLLRAGGLSRAEIEAVLGRALGVAQDGVVSAPGQLASHYAPRGALRLNARALEEGEAGLDFGGVFSGARGAKIIDLSPEKNLREAAARLFAALHELNALGVKRIAAAPVPHEGLGEAINDRLQRAAAPRE